MLEEGYSDTPAGEFYVIILPHEGEVAATWCETLERTAAWCQETHPKNLYTRTAGPESDIDSDLLIRILRGRTLQ
jgi:hypothetical protein